MLDWNVLRRDIQACKVCHVALRKETREGKKCRWHAKIFLDLGGCEEFLCNGAFLSKYSHNSAERNKRLPKVKVLK